MELKTIKEAAERETSRDAHDFDDGDPRQVADRAMLLAAVPDLLAEIDRRGSEIVKARNDRDGARAEIERLEKARALWESRWHAMAVSARALGRKVETLRDGMCRALSHIGSQEPQRAAVALGEALKETS